MLLLLGRLQAGLISFAFCRLRRHVLRVPRSSDLCALFCKYFDVRFSHTEGGGHRTSTVQVEDGQELYGGIPGVLSGAASSGPAAD